MSTPPCPWPRRDRPTAPVGPVIDDDDPWISQPNPRGDTDDHC